MLCTIILVSLWTVASTLAHMGDGGHQPHDSYQHSLTLARRVHRDVRKLLPLYLKDQMGSHELEVSDLFMKGLPSCSTNYTDWLSLEGQIRLQQDHRDLEVLGLHVDACRQSKFPPGVAEQSPLSRSLELLHFNIRDLRAQIHQQMQSQPLPSPVSMPASLCAPDTLWYGSLQGYIVLRDLERCMQRVVRDFTLLHHPRA